MIGSFSVSLRNLSSTGSVPSFHASSSTALSSAKNDGTSLGARMKPGVMVSRFTKRSCASTFWNAYIRAVAGVPVLITTSSREVPWSSAWR